MSISSEWNSLKASWLIILIFFIGRIYLSGSFLLSPVEALYWQAGTVNGANSFLPITSPLLTWMHKLSIAILGHHEIAVRLPATLALSLCALYMALLSASMFSWHAALHVTLLTQGILLYNLSALVVSPLSILALCWAAVCYHASQAMHENRTGGWLLAGFWFGLGLLTSPSMLLLLPCLVFCFIFIRPFRKCLLYAGPWLGLFFSLCIFLSAALLLHVPFSDFIAPFLKPADFLANLIPDLSHSIGFLSDQAILITPFVLLLVFTGWVTGSSGRRVVRADVQFLSLTSLPVFLFFLIFPVFENTGPAWSMIGTLTAIILIGGLYSSTRTGFKGRPHRRWLIALVTAYCFSIPLLLKIPFPSLPLPVDFRQAALDVYGWDGLGRDVGGVLADMPDPEKTFVFSVEPGIAAELAFYTPGRPDVLSLDHRSRTDGTYAPQEFQRFTGRDGVGVVRTTTAVEKLKTLFARVERSGETVMDSETRSAGSRPGKFILVRCFDFSGPGPSTPDSSSPVQ
ncbi:MAG: glycosyltransferase family 39 protein [Desulfobulbaceae bacterium]